MATHIDGVSSQGQKQIGPKLDPHVIEDLRHKNIFDVAKIHGISMRDIEDYLAAQGKWFQNTILQDYEVYAQEGTLPPPEVERFPIHAKEMFLGGDERQFFHQEMQALATYQPDTSVDGAKPKVRFKEMNVKANEVGEGPGQDVIGIADKALSEWEEFFGEMQLKIIDNQMVQDLKSKTAELNRDVQRIIALVRAGVVDPEYVLIAAAKSNMLQNGTFFTWKGKRIATMNEQMNKVSKDLYKMNPNDAGYMKELQMSQAKTRSGSSSLQMELMDLQKFAQNIATTLEWASNAVRMFAQMRQTPTQAIAAR